MASPKSRMRRSAGAAALILAALAGTLAPMASAESLTHGDAERGRALIVSLGCAVCHPLKERDTRIRKEAPDLTFEGDRVRPDWLFRFLREPTRLRPAIKGRMPDFRLAEPEALAIVEFTRTLRNPAAAGTDSTVGIPKEHRFKADAPGAAAGKKHAQTYRCAQCHADSPRADAKAQVNDLAPRFADAAQRLDPDWVFRWIRDPQALAPGTQMPGLFYSDGEPNMDGADRIMSELRDFLMARGSSERFPEYEEARRRYPEVSAPDGRRLVVALNCIACHPLKSLPSARPLAPSLLAEGSRVRRAWLERFLARPHVIKPEYALLKGGTRMPGFALQPGEAEDVAAYMERVLVAPEADSAVPPAESELPALRAQGRAIAEQRHCRDCHRVVDSPGGIGPDLTRAGERLQYGWVLAFVQDPAHYLETRMPNLNLSPGEARAVTAYVLGPKE